MVITDSGLLFGPPCIFETFATVAPDVELTHGTSVRDKCAILAPNVGPTSNISILDKFATIAGPHQWRPRFGNFGGWIDAKGKVCWGTEVTHWVPGAKTQ